MNKKILLLLNYFDDLIFFLDKNYKIILANKTVSEFFGLNGSIIGKDVIALLKANASRNLSGSLFENKELKEVINFLTEFPKKKSFISWKIVEIELNDKNALVLIGKNITEVKRLQKKKVSFQRC